jgi:hypothetical protein
MLASCAMLYESDNMISEIWKMWFEGATENMVMQKEENAYLIETCCEGGCYAHAAVKVVFSQCMLRESLERSMQRH